MSRQFPFVKKNSKISYVGNLLKGNSYVLFVGDIPVFYVKHFSIRGNLLVRATFEEPIVTELALAVKEKFLYPKEKPYISMSGISLPLMGISSKKDMLFNDFFIVKTDDTGEIVNVEGGPLTNSEDIKVIFNIDQNDYTRY